MKYTSLYQYLDEVLSDVENPSKEQIQQAKNAYWKLWFTHYRRQRRKQRKEFTLSFDAQTLKHINDKKGTQSVSQFLYTSIYRALSSENASAIDTKLLAEVNQQLMQVINLLEELLENNATELTLKILERLEQLELGIAELLNNATSHV